MAPGSSDPLIKAADEYFDALIKSRFIEMFDGDYDYRPLGDLFKTSSGGTPLKSKQEYYREGDTPWLTSGEINKLHITSANTRITRLALEETSAKIPPIGSVLVSMYGSIGYAGILEFESAINQAICAIHPNEHFVPIWLCYYIRSKKDDLTNQGAGAALTNISQEKIRKLKVMCPPAELQNQFADFVKQVDKSKLVFREMVSKLDELVRARFIELFGEVNQNSKQWKLHELNDLFDLQMGKTPSRDNQGYWKNGTHSWVSISDMPTNNNFISGNTKEKISDLAVKESGIKRIPEWTVLMSFKLSIGKVAITTTPMYTNEAIMAFIDRDKTVNNLFLSYLLKQLNWTIGANKAVKGTTLNKSTIKHIKIPLPPLELQNQFADFVKQVDKLKSEILEGVKKLRIPQ